MKYCLVGLIALLNCSYVFADTELKCIPDSVVHNDILSCYIEEYSAVDKKLNDAYKQKIEVLKKSKRDKLQKLQRQWIAKKESSCVADEANYGRESHFDAVQCEIDMTKERLAFLQNYK